MRSNLPALVVSILALSVSTLRPSDGSSISPGGGGSATSWAQTLAIGAVSGGTNPLLSSGDSLVSAAATDVSVIPPTGQALHVSDGVRRVSSLAGVTLGVEGVPLTAMDLRTLMSLYDTSSPATGSGGGISFGYQFSSGNYTVGACVQGLKENNTSGDYSTCLDFVTRPFVGGNFTRAARISSQGQFDFGTITDVGTAVGDLSTSGQWQKYRGLQTAGVGLSPVMASGDTGTQTGAGPITICSYTSSAAGDFEAGGQVTPILGGAGTITLSYTSSQGSAISAALPFANAAGGTASAVTAGTVISYCSVQAGTTITLSLTGTVVTSYRASGSIRQVR